MSSLPPRSTRSYTLFPYPTLFLSCNLYDTYGFPLDWTQDVLRAEGRPVDTKGFDEAMARQKAEARKAWAGSGEAATEDVWYRIRDEKGASEFLGYTGLEAEGCIDALVINGVPADEAKAGDSVILVANQTPFYEIGRAH